MTGAAAARQEHATPPLHVAALRKRYGAHSVLAGVDLALAAGDAVGLVGVNGAGKTTLIKCVLDLCSVDSGRIELFGLGSTDPASRARLAYLPERFIPPHYLLCREFLEMMLALCASRYEHARAVAVLTALELDQSVLGRPVRQLSKGMTQKLGLAACLLVERDLYVLDEPMSGLDPASRVAVKSALRDLHARGRTVLFTSHVLSDVEELCDRVAVLHGGTMRFDGTGAALCQRYAEPVLERAFMRCIRGD